MNNGALIPSQVEFYLGLSLSFSGAFTLCHVMLNISTCRIRNEKHTFWISHGAVTYTIFNFTLSMQSYAHKLPFSKNKRLTKTFKIVLSGDIRIQNVKK